MGDAYPGPCRKQGLKGIRKPASGFSQGSGGQTTVFSRAGCDAGTEEGGAGGWPQGVLYGRLDARRGIPSRLVLSQWKASCPIPYRQLGCPHLSQGLGGSSFKLLPSLGLLGATASSWGRRVGDDPPRNWTLSLSPRWGEAVSALGPHPLPGCFLCNRGSFLPLTPRVLFFWSLAKSTSCCDSTPPRGQGGECLSPRGAGAKEEKAGALCLNPEGIRNGGLVLSCHLFCKTSHQLHYFSVIQYENPGF